MNTGYIKLWRLTLEKAIFQNPLVFQFAVWCLLKATHKAKRQIVGRQVVDLKPGQFITGREKAALELGSTPGKSRSCLQTLSNIGFLTSKSTNKFTIISIVNWDAYQSEEERSDQNPNQQTTNKQPTNDHEQEWKEEKKEKKDKRKERKVSRPLPPDFFLDDTMTEYAIKKGISKKRLDDVFEHFKDHHAAKGSLMKDWAAAWRTWCMNDQKYGQPRGRSVTRRDETPWERAQNAGIESARMLRAIREREQDDKSQKKDIRASRGRVSEVERLIANSDRSCGFK